MDQKKIGNFIKELRAEKNLTQERLSKQLNVGREAVSKWERGLNFPDIIVLKKLTKILDVSIDELIAGEKGTKQKNTEALYIDRYLLTKNTKKLKLFLTFTVIILMVITFLSYYFINLYKSIHIYTVKGNNENFEIQNGLFIKTNEKTYFNLGTISTNKKINGIKIYYVKNQKENLILKGDPEKTFISENNGYDEYFKGEDLKEIINNLHLVIYYENKEEDIKLNFKEDYVNKNLIFKNATAITDNDEKHQQEFFQNEDFISKIKKKFNKNSDDEYSYHIKKSSTNFTFNFTPNILICIKDKNKKEIEEYYYDLDLSLINYRQKESKTNENFEYKDGIITCVDENCFSEEKVLEFLNIMDETIN